jgi:hypothetical protein
MTTECPHSKNGNLLTCKLCKEERAKANNMKCNCENNLCGTHPAGACKTPAGKARMMYVGAVCDDCANCMDRRFMLIDESGTDVAPAKPVRPIDWQNFDAYNGVDDR